MANNNNTFIEQRLEFQQRYIDPNYTQNNHFNAVENRQLFKKITDAIAKYDINIMEKAGTMGLPKNQHRASLLHSQMCIALDAAKDAHAKWLLAVIATEDVKPLEVEAPDVLEAFSCEK